MKYLLLIAVVFFASISAEAQVFNGTFDKWTGNVPDGWTVSKLVTSGELRDSATLDPYFKCNHEWSTVDGASVIFLIDTSSANPYGAPISPNTKKITFKYLAGVSETATTQVVYKLFDHTGTIYYINKYYLRTVGAWTPVEVPITPKQFDNSGTNYIQIAFGVVDGAYPSGADPKTHLIKFSLDDVALDTSAVLGVEPNISNEEFAVFPNPVSTQATFRFGNSLTEPIEISVFDVTGRTVKHLTSENTETLNLDCSDLPNGVYYVRSNGGKYIRNNKLVVSH